MEIAVLIFYSYITAQDEINTIGSLQHKCVDNMKQIASINIDILCSDISYTSHRYFSHVGNNIAVNKTYYKEIISSIFQRQFFIIDSLKTSFSRSCNSQVYARSVIRSAQSLTFCNKILHLLHNPFHHNCYTLSSNSVQ